ncbi:5926_t:CDS:1, partial [Paraglomus occultum]
QHYRNVLDNLTNFEIDFINKRRESLQKTDQKNNDKRDDFLTMLLTQNNDADSSTDIIKQNIREMFSAGTGTTTSALCAVAYLLAKNPECEERMVDELFSVLGKDRNIEPADLPKLTYTEMVINETMRLYPVVPLTYRYSPDTELKIGEYVFPPNTIFTINLAHMHRNPQYFPNPTVFDPERFAGNWKERYHHAFSPFGQTIKACPGKNFAMAEMKTILAQVYRKYTFKLVKPDDPLHFKFSLVNDISKLEAYLEERKI